MATDVDLALLTRRIDELERDVLALMHEIGGVQNGSNNHRPVRERIHKLESNDAAAILLAEFKKQRRRQWQWTVMAAFAGIGAVMTLLVVVVAIFSGPS